MKSSTPLDYAVFQLSPRHSRCELFVSSNGNSEKLASGLVKPFVSHLKVAEEQVAEGARLIKLDVQGNWNGGTWFTKGTLERYVRFVNRPEVLETVNTLDAEMSQLEAARKIYSQGVGEQPFGASGGNGTSMAAGADATKKELLRAIDVRLTAVRQDLTTAYANASAAGFNPETASDLRLFSDCFGAHRLNEACTKFISLCQRRPELITSCKPGVEDPLVRASWGSDMSIDDPSGEPSGSHQANQEQQLQNSTQSQNHLNQSKASKKEEETKQEESIAEPLPIQPSQSSRRLSVQDRINLFENKQKENSGGKTKPVELRRLSSDVSNAERAVLRRWSGASDMSIDLGNDKKDNNSIESPLVTPSSSSVLQSKSNVLSGSSADVKDQQGLSDTASSVKVEVRSVSGSIDQGEAGLKGKANSKDEAAFEGKLTGNLDRGESVGSNNQDSFQSQTGSSEDAKISDQLPRVRGYQSHTRSISGQFEGGFGMKVREMSYKDSESDQPAQQHWRSVSGEIEQVGKELMREKLEIPKRKVQKPNSAGPEQILKMQGRRDDIDQDSFGNVQASSVEQVQRVRQSKGNQELNDELKLKANELEKLFSEHKLRVPGDQSSSARRSKATESQVEQTISSQYSKPVAAVEVVTNASSNAKFSTPPPMKVDHQEFGRQNSSELSLSDESRGKFYEKYMEKRDAKLREEWGTKRAEKEAKLKAMQDNLEWSRAELKAKFSGSTVSSAHQRAEKLRLFHLRSSIKKGQNLADNFQSEGDENPSEFSEQKYYRQEDSASRSSQTKKMFPNRNTSTSTPRTAVPLPRSGRRRVSENTLAQSVPNFSDFRKENTKPSSGISKTANRVQAKPYSRSKSTNQETPPLVKEEKPRRSQSLRKSSASPTEFEDLPPLNSNDIVLAPLKFDKEQSEQGLHESFLKKADPKLFEAEYSVNLAKQDAEEEEINGKPRLSQESDNMSKSENGDSVLSLSQVENSSVAEIPGSPGESPVSWNSRLNNPFSYPHEISDIDASVDSPIGSPASWNSHSLVQNDADRTRKKWGSAQKPFLVANSSHNLPRKDVTKGFKRLLQFGRKSRGSESLVDWISATTSEGDDDAEDGRDRDPAFRSSEDLRKSRMGFNESELFHEQVQGIHSSIPAPPANFKLRDDHMSGSSIKAPKSSFFSLSSFRSKGSESKLR